MNPQVNINSYDEINVQLHNDQPHSFAHLHFGHFGEQILCSMSSICTPEIKQVIFQCSEFSRVQMKNKVLKCTWINKDVQQMVHCSKPSSAFNKDAYNAKKVIVKLRNLTGED